MAVHIRMSRHGAKKSPFYRIVVADQRSPRDGRFIESLGTFNPNVDPSKLVIDRERFAYWTSKGARPSPTVLQVMKQHPVAG